MTGRPRVVFLTHHLPWPPHSGGRLREFEQLSRLGATNDVEVVAVSKTPQRDALAVRELAPLVSGVRVFPVERQTPWPVQAVGPLTARHLAPDVQRYLAQRLSRGATVLHVEGHYLVPHVPQRFRRQMLVVDHNVESVLFEQQAALTDSPEDRRRLRLAARHTRNDEVLAWRAAYLVGMVTEDDRETALGLLPATDVRVLPDGADHLALGSVCSERKLDDRQRHLVYLGNFGYEPNVQAVRSLLDQVMPVVAEHVPDVTLTIVGADPPQWLSDLVARRPWLAVTGRVPQVAPYLDAADLVVLPLWVGGGVKVKVLEALRRGRCVVTTPVGAQGLGGLASDALVVRPTLWELTASVIHLLRQPNLIALQQAHALAAAERLPTWDDAADRLQACWDEVWESRTLPFTDVTASALP
jgi:glycosyltransferase involved in cell wall biosynthesis